MQPDALGVFVTQSPAVFSAPEIAVPRLNEATAMPAPMMARISAYSAAEAPESSRSMLMKVFMIVPFPKGTRRHGAPVIAKRFGKVSYWPPNAFLRYQLPGTGPPANSQSMRQGCFGLNFLSTIVI